MKNIVCSLLAIIVFANASANAEEKKVKTVEVKHRDLTLNIPDSWKSAPNASSMRLGTYQIPAADEDSDAGELTIYNFGGGGGSVADNLQRWIGQFSSSGRKSKITQGTAGENKYYYADISGTYNKPVGPPILRKTEAAPDYRMHAVILVIPEKGVYFLKLTGPDATVAAEGKNLRKAFGGNAENEKDYEL